MKRVIISFFLSAISIVVFGQAKDVDELKKINESWIGAYPQKDTATLSKILAYDFMIITPVGDKLTKAQLLKSAASSNVKSSKVESVEVRFINDNVALIIAKASFTSMENGKEISGRTSYMDVYKKRYGRWVAVAAHVTSLK